MELNKKDKQARAGLESLSREQDGLGAFLRAYKGSNGFTQAWRCEHCGGHNHDAAINCQHCERFPQEAA